ncbi:MAG: carbohydrate-binding family 9-like protein [Planctomycetales bacterium]|nr:carbohydrate-binding family 9-like protein [Planctomycetales bacterium]
MSTTSLHPLPLRQKLYRKLAAGIALALAGLLQPVQLRAVEPAEKISPQLTVKHCDDFEVNGKGDAEAWKSTEWVALNRRPPGQSSYTARIKVLYSDTGLYVLFDGNDKKLHATLEGDYLALWSEDVYECFLWPDGIKPLYFEYEISPLGYELPLLTPNTDDVYFGWIPWRYEGNRKTRKAISIRGGEQKSMADIEGWSAEVFIPYELLKPLDNVPPKSGTRWRANFYRIDRDDNMTTQWDWSRVGPSFHEFKKYGQLVFE